MHVVLFVLAADSKAPLNLLRLGNAHYYDVAHRLNLIEPETVSKRVVIFVHRANRENWWGRSTVRWSKRRVGDDILAHIPVHVDPQDAAFDSPGMDTGKSFAWPKLCPMPIGRKDAGCAGRNATICVATGHAPSLYDIDDGFGVVHVVLR